MWVTYVHGSDVDTVRGDIWEGENGHSLVENQWLQ